MTADDTMPVRQLRRVGPRIFSATPTAAGDAGLVIDGVGLARFDLIEDGHLTWLELSDDVDALALVSLIGWDETSAALNDTANLSVAPTLTARQCAHLARLLLIRRAPVMRGHRPEFDAAAALLADQLLQDDFGGESIAVERTDSLTRLAAGLGALDNPVQRARSDARIARAVWLGVTLLDLDDAPSDTFERLANDLPDPDDTTFAEILSAPAAVEEIPAFKGAGSHEPTPEVELPAFRGGPSAKTPQPRSQPLVWAHFGDESVLPENDGFDAAVTIVQEGAEANVTVLGISVDAPAIFARVFDPDGELASVGALAPSDDGWVGRLPLPEHFAADTHRFEIVDTIRRPSAFDASVIERQWAVLQLARDVALNPVLYGDV